MDIKNVNVELNLRLSDEISDEITQEMVFEYCRKLKKSLPKKYGTMSLDFSRINYFKINENDDVKETNSK